MCRPPIETNYKSEEAKDKSETESCLPYKYASAGHEAKEELIKAIESWPEFNSAHEGWAVLLEEVNELWEHVKIKQKYRDIKRMRKEAIQVAAMALRFAAEICNEKRGRR
jgi:hypothetical protein